MYWSKDPALGRVVREHGVVRPHFCSRVGPTLLGHPEKSLVPLRDPAWAVGNVPQFSPMLHYPLWELLLRRRKGVRVTVGVQSEVDL